MPSLTEWKPGTVVEHKDRDDGWTRIALMVDGTNRSFQASDLRGGATEETTGVGAEIVMRFDDAVTVLKK